MYLFTIIFSFDATHEENRLGRYVKDSDSPNAKIKPIIIDGKMRLCIFAIKDIMKYEEISYDYGLNNRV